MKLLQINIDLRSPAAPSKDGAKDAADFARQLTKVPGLRWKIWIGAEARSEVGGIYLFESQATADAFLAGPLFAQIKGNPGFKTVQAKLFDIDEATSAITHAPLEKAEAISASR